MKNVRGAREREVQHPPALRILLEYQRDALRLGGIDEKEMSEEKLRSRKRQGERERGRVNVCNRLTQIILITILTGMYTE